MDGQSVYLCWRESEPAVSVGGINRVAFALRHRLALAAVALVLVSGWAGLIGKILYLPWGTNVPETTVWAWERNEDLTFLDPKTTNVAFYAGTIRLRDDHVEFVPRIQKLDLGEEIRRYPVVRIHDMSSGNGLNSENIEQVVSILKEVFRMFIHRIPRTAVFRSIMMRLVPERQGYLALLKRVRKELPKGTHIAVTALASWCLGDRWLPKSDIDEAVVMLFSMGAGKRDVVRLLEKQRLSAGEGIPTSIGVATNEPLVNSRLRELGIVRAAKSVFVFCPLPWTEDRYQRLKTKVGCDETKS